jgi:hypothetical protein
LEAGLGAGLAAGLALGKVTVNTFPHCGHFAFFPTAVAGAFNFFPHGQITLIDCC